MKNKYLRNRDYKKRKEFPPSFDLIKLKPNVTSAQTIKFLNIEFTSLLAIKILTIASPVMFLRIMSRILSTPKIRAIPSVGRPTCSKTMANMIRPTPGTPAVPILANMNATNNRTKVCERQWNLIQIRNKYIVATLHDRRTIHVDCCA